MTEQNTPSETEQQIPVYGVTEDDAFAAIFEDKPMTIKFFVGEGQYRKELSLRIMWPDADDEAQIAIRAAEYLGMPPEQATNVDFMVSRGRAAIEQLIDGGAGSGHAYPEWLTGPNGELLSNQPVNWRGTTRLQPVTGRVKNKVVFANFWMAYNAVISRFQHLVFGL